MCRNYVVVLDLYKNNYVCVCLGSCKQKYTHAKVHVLGCTYVYTKSIEGALTSSFTSTYYIL